MKLAYLIVGIAMAVSMTVGFLAPDAANFREPFLFRIIFTHLSCAFLASSLVVITAYFAFRSIRTRSATWDTRLGAALELGFIFSSLTLATGVVFSRAQWGAWWHNDPRQTSYLMVFLMLGAGLAIRSGLPDEDKKRSASAAYTLATILPNLFLTFVFPRLSQVERASFHPSNTVASGSFSPLYANIFLANFTCFALIAYLLYAFRIRVSNLESQLELIDGHNQTPGGSPSPDGVVRPVALSPKP